MYGDNGDHEKVLQKKNKHMLLHCFFKKIQNIIRISPKTSTFEYVVRITWSFTVNWHPVNRLHEVKVVLHFDTKIVLYYSVF